MRRVAVVHRIAIQRPAAAIRLHVQPADAPGQRVQLFDFECEPEPTVVERSTDAFANAVLDLRFAGAPEACRVTTTSVLLLRPRVHATALDRPWEHAVIEHIRRRRRVDALALRCAGTAVRALPARFPLRELAQHRPVSELRQAGLAVRCVYGYRIDEPVGLHRWHAVYTPDWGWVDLDRTPKIAVAWSPPDTPIAVTADPEGSYASELDVFDM